MEDSDIALQLKSLEELGQRIALLSEPVQTPDGGPQHDESTVLSTQARVSEALRQIDEAFGMIQTAQEDIEDGSTAERPSQPISVSLSETFEEVLQSQSPEAQSPRESESSVHFREELDILQASLTEEKGRTIEMASLMEQLEAQLVESESFLEVEKAKKLEYKQRCQELENQLMETEALLEAEKAESLEYKRGYDELLIKEEKTPQKRGCDCKAQLETAQQRMHSAQVSVQSLENKNRLLEQQCADLRKEVKTLAREKEGFANVFRQKQTSLEESLRAVSTLEARNHSLVLQLEKTQAQADVYRQQATESRNPEPNVQNLLPSLLQMMVSQQQAQYMKPPSIVMPPIPQSPPPPRTKEQQQSTVAFEAMERIALAAVESQMGMGSASPPQRRSSFEVDSVEDSTPLRVGQLDEPDRSAVRNPPALPLADSKFDEGTAVYGLSELADLPVPSPQRLEIDSGVPVNESKAAVLAKKAEEYLRKRDRKLESIRNAPPHEALAVVVQKPRAPRQGKSKAKRRRKSVDFALIALPKNHAVVRIGLTRVCLAGDHRRQALRSALAALVSGGWLP